MLKKYVAQQRTKGRGGVWYEVGQSLMLPPTAGDAGVLAGRLREWNEGDEAQEQSLLAVEAEKVRVQKIEDALAVLRANGVDTSALDDAFDPAESESEETADDQEDDDEPAEDDEEFFVPSKPLTHFKNEELEAVLDEWGVDHEDMDRGQMFAAVKALMEPEEE